jgi:hypothetical protein
MNLSAEDALLVRVWMTSKSLAEAVQRLAGTMTARELRGRVGHLRRLGVPVPTRPAGRSGGTPVTLTPHPAGDGTLLDGRGYRATPVGPLARVQPDPPEEGPWRCAGCGAGGPAGGA